MMKLIEEYLSNIKLMKLELDDYSDKRKVKKSNKLADRNRKIAKLIDKENDAIKTEYLCLLDSPDEDVRGWVAHHVIELMTFDKTTNTVNQIVLQEAKALKIIQSEAENHPDNLIRLGNTMWLEQYYKDHPEDIEL